MTLAATLPIRKTPAIIPPAHLQARGKAWFSEVVAEWSFAQHELALVTAAAEMLDNAEVARVKLLKDGRTLIDRFGQVKPHPSVDDERQSLLAFVRIRRELALDCDPPADSRPPLRKGYA